MMRSTRQWEGVPVIEQRLQTSALDQFHGDVIKASSSPASKMTTMFGCVRTRRHELGLESGEEFGRVRPCFGTQFYGFDRNGAADDRSRAL